MPSKNPTIQKAYKDGVITKTQYDKLSDSLLLGIISKKKKKPMKKEAKKDMKKDMKKKSTKKYKK